MRRRTKMNMYIEKKTKRNNKKTNAGEKRMCEANDVSCRIGCARVCSGAAVAATVIFKNTIRQWQCIFTLVGQMIPVNGLLSPARTHTVRYACAPFIGFTAKRPSARLWLWLWLFGHLYMYITWHSVCAIRLVYYRITAECTVICIHIHNTTHRLCCICTIRCANQTKYAQFIRERELTKQYFKVYDLREGINERKKRKTNAKTCYFPFVRYVYLPKCVY